MTDINLERTWSHRLEWSDASGSTTIQALQKHMNQSGYGLTVDGIMGPQTIE